MVIKLRYIEPELRKKFEKRIILYGDFNVLNYLYNSQTEIHNGIDIYPDSTAVYLLQKYYYKFNGSKLISTDIQERLLEKAQCQGSRIFLFGDTSDVLFETCAVIKQRYKKIIISGAHNGYIYQNDQVINLINSSRSDIVFVGLGAGRQEKWINENYHKLNTRIIISTGGWFQFLSGQKKRAPISFIKLNLEWLWKIFTQFRKVWKRYLFGLPIFLFRVVTKRIILEIDY